MLKRSGSWNNVSGIVPTSALSESSSVVKYDSCGSVAGSRPCMLLCGIVLHIDQPIEQALEQNVASVGARGRSDNIQAGYVR